MTRQEVAVIALTVAMLLVVGAVLVVIFDVYTNDFTTDYSPIYLSAGEMKFFPNSDPVELGNVQFKVHNAWALNKRYTVQILPTGEDFLFQVDGKWYRFLDIQDLTPAFHIVFDGSSFVIYASARPMEYVLRDLFGGLKEKDVVVAADNASTTVHYNLVVTTLNGKHSVTVPFKCKQAPTGVDDVEIDPPNVVI